MPEKYLYNGKIMQRSAVEEAAKASKLDINAYVQKAGIKVINDTYDLGGKKYTAEQILEAADQSKIGFDDYIQKAGFKSPEKKNPVDSKNGGNLSQSSGNGLSESKETFKWGDDETANIPVTKPNFNAAENPVLGGVSKNVVDASGNEIIIKNEDVPIPETIESYKANLQDRLNNKVATDHDLNVISKNNNYSPQTAALYISGKKSRGALSHFNEIVQKDHSKLTEVLNRANAELGLTDTEDVFDTPESASVYIDKLKDLYSRKSKSEIDAVRPQGNDVNLTTGVQKLGDYDNIVLRKNNSVLSSLKSIISNKILTLVNDDEKLTNEQKVVKVANLVGKEYGNAQAAYVDRITQIPSMANTVGGAKKLIEFISGDTKNDIAVLNSIKGQIEFGLASDNNKKITGLSLQKAALVEEANEKAASGTITPEEKEEYEKQAAQIDTKISTIKTATPTKRNLFDKYPVLKKKAVIDDINDYNAMTSGNVEGYTEGTQMHGTLGEYLRNRGYDLEDQVVKDAVINSIRNPGTETKDYDFFGHPFLSAKGVFTSTGKSLGDITGFRDELDALSDKKTDELFQSEVGTLDEFQLTKGAKIGQNIGNTTGQVLGQGLLQVGTAGIGRLAGLTKVAAANAGFWSSGTLTSYDQAYKDSFDFIDSKVGRTAYAGLIALANGASEKIFPEAKLFQIPGVKDAIAELSSKIGTKGFTNELADQLLNKAKNSFVDYAKKYGKNVGQETVEEVATDLFESGTRFLFGDPNMNLEQAITSAKNTAIQTAIGTSVIGGYGAHKDVQQERNISPKSVVYNSAIYHDEALDAIETGFKQGHYNEQERNSKISMLNTAQKGVGELKTAESVVGRELTRPQKEVFVANYTAQALLNEQLKQTVDPELKGRIEGKLKNLQNQQRQVLEGDVNFDDHGNVIVPAKEDAEQFKIDGEIATRAEVEDILVKGKSEADKFDIEYIGKDDNLHQQLNKAGGTTEDNRTLSPKGREVVLSEGVNDLYAQLEPVAPKHYLDPLNKEQSINELSSQALTSPNSIKNEIGKDLTVKLIARNATEEINKSIQSWADKVSGDEVSSAEQKEADNHIKLLEKALEEKGKIHEESKPVFEQEETTIQPEGISKPIEDEITVKEMLDKPGTYKGERGQFYQDGQTVVFKVEGKNKEYELGNIDEVGSHSISNYGIYHEQSVVSVSDKGEISVRGQEYRNNYSDPTAAINYDKDGNILSVNLETTDGKKRTFRGNIAEDLAYQIHLKEITKDNAKREQFEQFINDEPAIEKEINDAGLSETTTEVTIEDNAPIQREKIIRNETQEIEKPTLSTNERGSGNNEPISSTDNSDTEESDGENIQPQQESKSEIVPPVKPPVEEESNEDEGDSIGDYEMTTSGEVNKFLSGSTIEDVFGDAPEGEQNYQVQKLSEMLQDGKNMIGKAMAQWGSDIADYGKPLFQYIQSMSNDKVLTNKKAVLLATFLGEMKEEMNRNPDRRSELSPLYNAVESYYQNYMNVRGKEVVAGRLLRLYRDKYLGDIFANKILEEAQIKEKQQILDAENNKNITDEVVAKKNNVTAEQKAADDKAENDAAKDDKKKKAKKGKLSTKEAENLAKGKLEEIINKTGSKPNLIDKINEALKRLNCK